MIDYSKNTVADISNVVCAGRRPLSYYDWFFGCMIFVLVTTAIGVVLEMEHVPLSGDACFLCPDDVGWALTTFAYAIPGLAFGSVIWALLALTRLHREMKSEQFKSTFLFLLVSSALLMVAIQYFYWLPLTKRTLNIDPELKMSLVRISTTAEPYSHPDEPNGTVFGTGIVVDSERGWIVTNAHVAMRVPSEVSFFSSVDPLQQFYSAKKIYVDPYLDIAILEARQSRFPARVRSATLDCEGIFEGDLVALGYTGTDNPTLRVLKGIGISSEVKYGRTWVAAYAGYKHGMSGGPTIGRQSGRVVGINTISSGHETYNLGYAVPAPYVCRIISLLRSGIDPTPPQLPLAFFDNLADEGELVVAETYPSPIEIPLIEGDIILGIEGRKKSIRSESDLMDALRGADYPVDLRITRDGTERLVSVSFSTMEDQLRPSVLYISRFVIGEARGSHRFPDGLKKELMIRMMEYPGFDEAGGILDRYDPYVIVSVDGTVFNDIQALHLYLSSAQSASQEAVFKLKMPHSALGMSYTYHRISIATDDIRLLE